MSSKQAFRNYGINIPERARKLRYYAWAAVDAYPMATLFSVKCEAVPEFVSENRLKEVPDLSQETIGVEVFAKDHGWVDSGTGDTRYIRAPSRSQPQRVEVLIHQAGQDCRVYIDAQTPTA
ncbi:hypothetical protein LUW77_09440 [Streptomyces radiopugnans]|uniref:hypothetical protein n=1 Tax=Streptomyces sp. KL2 TaxID=3050126 RepID=UPI002189AC50|nr:hypothetical protein LUW77_09440 [Streptomyces radiopugnans]